VEREYSLPDPGVWQGHHDGGATSEALLSVGLKPLLHPRLSECKKWIVSFNRTTDGMLCGYSSSKTNTPSLSDVCQASLGAPVVD
jgi:hypothetical protein